MDMDMDDSSLTTWLAIVRTIHFAGCLLIAGVWVFDRLVVKANAPQWRRVATAILLIATPLALVSGVVWFLLIAAEMSDFSFAEVIHHPDVWKLVWLHTRFGRAWQMHLLFWFGGVLIAAIRATFKPVAWMGVICGAGLVGGLAWAGHGSTGPVPMWHLSMDVMHLLASAIWPAGLLPMGLIIPRMLQSGQPEQCIALHRIIHRFSACSLVAVGLLTLTGLFNSWCLLGSFGLLIESNYGRLLVIKVVLFVAMIGFGAMNLLVWKPRLGEGPVPVRRLWRNVIIEMVLGTGVVGAVGVLGLLAPH